MEDRENRKGELMFFTNKYKTNLNRFWFYIDEVINRANQKYATQPDCRPIIKKSIDRIVESSKDEITSWDASTNVEVFSYKILYNVAFDILSSGEVHIYSGVLNPFGPGQKLMYIVDECLDYYMKNNYVTKAEAEEQKELLFDNISTVG